MVGCAGGPGAADEDAGATGVAAPAPAVCEVPVEQVWPVRHVVMWPDKTLDFIKVPGDESENARHFGIYASSDGGSGRLASVVSLFSEEGGASAQFRKFATLPEFQRRGLGTALLCHVIGEARAQGAQRLWCNARIEQADFYAKFGLRQTGESFTREGKDYAIMELRLTPDM
mmetsp:Transcript_109952/g.245498  ORF Transcript_109952/g.245498 Transcript_109952/m.245498 type:complete len:172 (-) Transcript_109952:23-538(-)